MNDERGYALFLLLYLMLLLTVLATAVLHIALMDMRVSGHMAEADRAYYSAEAGMEWMLVDLPRDIESLTEYTAEKEFGGSVQFVASVHDGDEPYVKRITSTGHFGNKSRTVEVQAGLLPFGGYSIIAEEMVLEQVRVSGGLLAAEVIFAGNECRVAGELCYKDTVSGDYVVDGQHCLWEGEDFPEMDFAVFVAWAEGWLQPPQMGEEYCLNAEYSDIVNDRLFVPGDLVIEAGFHFDGVIVVQGDVTLHAMPIGAVVLLAEKEVRFAWHDFELTEDVLVLYSGEVISNEAPLDMNGVLMAPVVELSDAVIRYDDAAVMGWLTELPEALLTYCPSFAVTWLEAELRR